MGKKNTKGFGGVYERGNIWWIQFNANGKCFRESSKSSKQGDAVDLLKKRQGEVQAQGPGAADYRKVKVSELVGDFLQQSRIDGAKSNAFVKMRWEKHLSPFFSVYRAEQVTTDAVRRYIDRRQQQGAANATVNRELAILRRAFRIGLQSTPPKVRMVPQFPRLSEDANIRQGFLEDAHLEKLIESCPTIWFRAILEVARTCGWRSGEIKGMRVHQLDLLRREIRLESTQSKNGEARTAPLTQKAFLLLSQLAQGKRPEDFLFTREDGSPVKDFRVVWAHACKHAGCPDLLFHDLRRTAARNLRRAGVAEGVIMEIAGWKTNSIFRRYAIVDGRDKRSAMAALESAEAARNESTKHNSSTVEAKPESVLLQ